jgi:hypothetical protein
MAELWIEETGSKVVWHRFVGRVGAGRYRAACGWEMNLRGGGRLWPVKFGQPGLPPAERCDICMARRTQ